MDEVTSVNTRVVLATQVSEEHALKQGECERTWPTMGLDRKVKPDENNETPVVDETSRQKIVRISADLFAEKGYHATGIKEIGDAVGLGRGALYYHIRSKENLLYDISITPLREVLETAQNIANLDLSAPDRVVLLATERLESIVDKRSQWNVALYQSNNLSTDLRTEVDLAVASYEATWERVLEEGAIAGNWNPVPGLVLKGILGMLNGTYLWLDPEGRIKPSEIARMFANLVLLGLCKRDGISKDWLASGTDFNFSEVDSNSLKPQGRLPKIN